jgi:NTE family protein
MKIKYLFILFFSIQILYPQQDSLTIPKKEKLKVGVVLSGGGAKGLAHIGALKIIEEAGVQIDYIAGTSMGAIIGGLYAAGYTPQQMDSIFDTTNFNALIRDEIPREDKTFFEREQDEKYAFSLNFDDFKIRTPSGLSKGQNVYNFFSQLTAHVQEEDFSKLPVPFFCVATNLETGEEIIIDSGSLALALSASGAIPSVFRPIEIDEQLHTDGGVVNNYPVEELRNRGADIIIGVDVQDSLFNKSGLKSGLDIMGQIINFRTIKAMESKSELTDIYIRPNINKYSVLDFDKGRQIISNGEQAAKNQLESLQELAKNQSGNFRDERIHVKDSIKINKIQFSGNENFSRNYIRGKLKLEQNETTSFTDLSHGINNLSATNNFDRIHYNLKKTEANAYDIYFDFTESDEFSYVKFGLHYDDLYKSALLLNFTRKKLLVNNDIFSLDLILGDNIRYNLNYYIDKGNYWSVGFRSRFNRFENNVDFSFVQNVLDEEFGDFNVNKIQLLNQDFTNQLYVETLLFSDFKFGLGIEQKWLRAKTETILANQDEEQEEPETIIEEFNLLSNYGYLEYDSLDHKYYPKQGFYFYGDMHFYLTSIFESKSIEEFSIVKGEAAYVQPLGKRVSLKVSSEMGFRLGNEAFGGLNFFLGGYGNQPINNFKPFYGYDFISLSGDSYIKGGLDLYYNFYKKHYLIASGNFANIENNLFDDGEWFSEPDFTGYAIGYGLDTFIGPLDFKYSYSPEVERGIWFISLGHRF